MRLVEVVGARPNFMKVAPLHRSLTAKGFAPRLVHTGQHYDWEMSKVFLEELGLPSPDAELNVGSGTHAEQTAQVMLKLEPFLIDTSPDVVVVVGDVNSTLASALTAVKLQVPVVHVEAGLRSFDRKMPEEINRKLTDAVSDLLFAPSRDAVTNLRREGIPDERIHLVGNVMIDSLDFLLDSTLESSVMKRLNLAPGTFLLVTLHRPSNVDDATSLARVTDVLKVANSILPVVLVAHPRTKKRLVETGFMESLDDIRILDPLGYVDFLRLMSESAAVLTDSGGIQEETTALGIPCLTLRETTERPITVWEGTNEVVGMDVAKIQGAVSRLRIRSAPGTRRPELWDGHAAERIASILIQQFGT